MQIRVGYELVYQCPQEIPMILMLNIHYSRAQDIVMPDILSTEPCVPVMSHRDHFGNWCSRIVAPAGKLRLSATAVVRDPGTFDRFVPEAKQHAVRDLPEETLVFLLGSRYCETDLLGQIAWDLFANTPPGWARVQAICDYVHNYIVFGYENARPTKTAWEAFQERKGGVPRLCPSRDCVPPLHEHSGALRDWLPGRHRRSAALWRDGLRRVDRSLHRR